LAPRTMGNRGVTNKEDFCLFHRRICSARTLRARDTNQPPPTDTDAAV